MPLEVPRYDQPHVRPAPMPGPPRRQEAPIEAFGGGPAAAGASRAAGDLAAAGGRIAGQEWNREAEAVIRDYLGQLSAEESRLALKAKALKGSEAFEATDQVLKEFDSSRDKLLQSISNPHVRDRVSAHAPSFRESLFRTSELHVAGERENHGRQRTAALVKQERSNAIDGYVDPDNPTKPLRVTKAIARQRAAIADQLRGQAPETIEAAQAMEESKTHLEVIDRMLTGGNDALAQKYYEANQAGFFGDDKTQVEKALQSGSRLGAASRLVEDAFTAKFEKTATGGNNWTLKEIPATRTIEEFRATLPKDLDDKTREIALDLARTRIRDRHMADEQRQDLDFKEAWNVVAAGGAVSPLKMQGLDPERQRALNTFSRQLARGEEPETNPVVLTEIYAMPKDALAKLSQEQLLARYRNSLSPVKYDWLLDRWAAARDAKVEKFQSLISDEERILKAAQGLGIGGIEPKDTYEEIKKKEDKAAGLWKLRQAVDARMAADHAASGKNPDDKRKAEILAGVVRDLSKEFVIEHYDMTGQKDAFTDDFGRRHEYPDTKLRLMDITPGHVKNSIFKMPWKTRQEFFNLANAGKPFGLDAFKNWEDANRERVNLAYLALEAGEADDKTIQRILMTGK